LLRDLILVAACVRARARQGLERGGEGAVLDLFHLLDHSSGGGGCQRGRAERAAAASARRGGSLGQREVGALELLARANSALGVDALVEVDKSSAGGVSGWGQQRGRLEAALPVRLDWPCPGPSRAAPLRHTRNVPSCGRNGPPCQLPVLSVSLFQSSRASHQCLVWFWLGKRALPSARNSNTTHSKPAVWSWKEGSVRRNMGRDRSAHGVGPAESSALNSSRTARARLGVRSRALTFPRPW
jgi:hypothetical protein